MKAINNLNFQRSKYHSSPHEYAIRGKNDSGEFNSAIDYINQKAHPEVFQGRAYNIAYCQDGYKYWTMGLPKNLTTIINRARIQVSVEPFHLYGNEEPDVNLIKNLLNMTVEAHPEALLCIMIDDYSIKGKQRVFKEDVQEIVYKHTSKHLDLLLYESELLYLNKSVLECLPSNHEANKYVTKNGKHPCSVFTASWYLTRAGLNFPMTRINGKNKYIKVTPTKHIKNYLPDFTSSSEAKALQILKELGAPIGDSMKIENVYY